MLGIAGVVFHEVDGRTVWRIDVVVDGVVSGHIDRGDGTYRYFEGADNDIIWSFADLDLDRLQARIRSAALAPLS